MANSRLAREAPAHAGALGSLPPPAGLEGSGKDISLERVEDFALGGLSSNPRAFSKDLFFPDRRLCGSRLLSSGLFSNGVSPSSPLLIAARISLAGMPLSIMPAISNLADQAPTAMTPVVLPSLGLDVPRITKLPAGEDPPRVGRFWSLIQSSSWPSTRVVRLPGSPRVRDPLRNRHFLPPLKSYLGEKEVQVGVAVSQNGTIRQLYRHSLKYSSTNCVHLGSAAMK